jgi:hypothetical protein
MARSAQVPFIFPVNAVSRTSFAPRLVWSDCVVSHRIRKRIEKAFGRSFAVAAAAYNLIRLPTLIEARAT